MANGVPANPAKPVPNPAAALTQKVYTSTIKSIGDADRHKGKVIGRNSQCASLTEALSQVGPTRTWVRGDLVRGSDVPLGTPIATFNYYKQEGTNGYAPKGSGGVSGGSHTGIYIGQDEQGVVILNQWHGSHGAKITHIPWEKWHGGDSEYGDKYYTIKNKN